MVREQRSGPFIAATLGALLLLLVYRYLTVPLPLFKMSVALVVCGAIFGLITAYWKISIHAAAYAGGIMLVSLVTQNPALLFFELGLPVIIWARLNRKRHDLYQSIGAAVLVCFCIYVTFKIIS